MQVITEKESGRKKITSQKKKRKEKKGQVKLFWILTMM